MIAFGGPAGPEQMPRCARSLAWTRQPHAELNQKGIKVQVVCPGVVATKFHTRQGTDLSALPRISAEDVVTASLRDLELNEVVCAPGVAHLSLLQAVYDADLAAFGA
jgi:uncharacterized protein